MDFVAGWHLGGWEFLWCIVRDCFGKSGKRVSYVVRERLLSAFCFVLL